MWNCFGVITLRQQRVSQQLVSGRQLRRQLHGALEGRDSGAVIPVFHIGLAEVYKAVGQVGLQFSDFCEFSDSDIEMALFVSLDARLHMLQCLGRSRLPRQPECQQDSNHGFSGSRTSRNWST